MLPRMCCRRPPVCRKRPVLPQEAPEAENASTVPQENGSALPDDGSGTDPGAEVSLAAPQVASRVGDDEKDTVDIADAIPEPSRASILAAFARGRTPPSPQPAA